MPAPIPSILCLSYRELTPSQLDGARLCLAAETDWASWLEQVESHGLSGIINAHLEAHSLVIPSAVKVGLKALNLRHKAAANARQQALSLIAKSFREAGVAFVALKGVALLPKLYQQPGLRPMRDMDLLVPVGQQTLAANCLRGIGFDLPEQQPSRFMRYVHQLPNATLLVNGFTCSVEIHHNAFSSDVGGKLVYPVLTERRQTLRWGDVEFESFDDMTMLHQVCRHLEGLHPGGVLKLINVLDVMGLALHVANIGRWKNLEERYPHVITTLRCLHMLTPLPDVLLQRVKPVNRVKIDGVGQIMQSLTFIVQRPNGLIEKGQMLFSPSDWWLHLHYNIDPDKRLWPTKWLHHPSRVAQGFVQRAVSALLGG